MGGSGDSETLRDVWASTDGATWTQRTDEAEWAARREFVPVALNGTLYVIGGGNTGNFIDDTPRKDVWASTDGATWTEVNDDPVFYRRSHSTTIAHDGKLYILGGWDSYRQHSINDVWRSSNGGASWARIDIGPWTNDENHNPDSYNRRIRHAALYFNPTP